MRIHVRVIPRSSKNLIEWEEGALKVHVTAPPVDGAANTALIALLAQCLAVHKRDIQIVRGTIGRYKIGNFCRDHRKDNQEEVLN